MKCCNWTIQKFDNIFSPFKGSSTNDRDQQDPAEVVTVVKIGEGGLCCHSHLWRCFSIKTKKISFYFSSGHFYRVDNLLKLLPPWVTKPKGIAQHFVSIIPDYLWAYDARLKPEYYQKPKIEAIYQPKTHTYQINHYSNLCYMIFHIFYGDICFVRFPGDKVLLFFFYMHEQA